MKPLLNTEVGSSLIETLPLSIHEGRSLGHGEGGDDLGQVLGVSGGLMFGLKPRRMRPLENNDERREVGSIRGDDLRLWPRWKDQRSTLVDLVRRPFWNLVLSGNLMWTRGLLARYGGGNVEISEPLFACSSSSGSGNMCVISESGSEGSGGGSSWTSSTRGNGFSSVLGSG